MPVLFFAPEGSFLVGPELTGDVDIWRCSAHTTEERDLGPVLFRQRVPAVAGGSRPDAEFFSPGRDPRTNEISYFQLVHERRGDLSLGRLPGIANALLTTRELHGEAVTVSRIDVEPRRRINLMQFSGQCPPNRKLMKELLFDSHFFGLPEIYKLVHVVRKGFQYIALARERHGSGTKVFCGKPGEMQEVAFEQRASDIRTPLGSFSPVSGVDGLSITADVAMLLRGSGQLAGLAPEALEFLVLRTLGLVSDKPKVDDANLRPVPTLIA